VSPKGGTGRAKEDGKSTRTSLRNAARRGHNTQPVLNEVIIGQLPDGVNLLLRRHVSY
jgi:hypothetical protein